MPGGICRAALHLISAASFVTVNHICLFGSAIQMTPHPDIRKTWMILTKLGGFPSFRQTLKWMEPIPWCQGIFACSRLAEAASAQCFPPVPPAVSGAMSASHTDYRYCSCHVRSAVSEKIMEGCEIQFFFPRFLLVVYQSTALLIN